jgi:hypothetical protein
LRRIVILVAALLVLAVGALLVAPRFVGPERYREAITAALARATGRQVTIAGPLALTLLPAPSLSAADVRVAGAPGAARPDMLRAAHIEARLAWLPLLGGRLVLRSLVLTDPVLDLASLPLGGAPRRASSNAPAAAARGAQPSEPVIAIERLAITNGTIIGSERIDGLDLDASMPDAGGPAHGAGRLTLHGTRLDFDVAVDRIGERTPFRLALGLPAAAAHLALAGEVVTPPNGAVTVEGKAKLTGDDFAALARLAHQAVPPGLARPFSATATLAAGRDDIRLDALSFALDETHGTGTLHIAPHHGAPGAPASFALTLALNQLDLDRLAAARAAAPQPARPPAQPPMPGRNAGAAAPAAPPLANDLIGELPSDLRGQIDLTVEALRWRDGVIRNARLHAALDHGVLAVSHLAASLPGGSDLSLSGTLDAAPGQAGGQRQFRGAVELESDNLRLLLDWLGARTAGIPADRLRKLTLSGQFTARPGQIDIGGLDLTVDATHLTGAATVALRRRIAIGVRLAVDQLNIDAYLPTAGPAAPPPSAPQNASPSASQGAPANSTASAPPADYPALLAAFDANIDAAIDTVTWRGQPARGIHLAATLDGGTLTLHEATIADIAGAGATARGALTGIGGSESAWHAAVTVRGPEIAHLVRLVAPDSTLGSALSGSFDAKADIAGERGGVALDLDLAALGGKLRLTGEVADSAANAPGADLGIEISHPSFVGLLRNVMPSYQPAGGDPGAIKLSGKFSETKGLLSVRDMSLSIGGLLVEGDTILARRGERPKLTADLRFNELALDRFLPARRTAARDDRVFPCADAACGGAIVRVASAVADAPVANRWSRDPLDLTALASFDADISVTGDGFSWGKWRLERPVAAVTLDNGLLRLARLSGGVFGGTVEATGQLAAADGQAKAEIAIRHAALEQALQETAGIGNLAGRADVDASLATAGLSDAALVAHLQGTGRLTSRDGTIAGIDLAAIGARLDDASRAADLPGLLRGLAGGKTRYRTLDGTFRVADGIIRSDDLHLVAESGEGHATATLDLPKWQTHDRLELRLGDHGALPPLALTVDGALDAPHIVFDVNALESYLAQHGAAKPPATAKPNLRDQLKTQVR